MAESHFDPYKTLIKIIHQRQNLIFGVCFENPPNTLLLYKEHMYSLFLLLYCYGQPEHKEIILDKVIGSKEHHILKMNNNPTQLQQNHKKKPSKNIIEMHEFVQTILKNPQQSINLHTLKQREYIRKSFKSIFQMQNKLTLKSEMNIIDFARLAASLIDASCQVKDYFDFQTIQFRHDSFEDKKLDVFIQINKMNQTYKYIKQNRNPKLIENNQGLDNEFQDEDNFMFQKMRIKRAQSIQVPGYISWQDDEEDMEEQSIDESFVAQSPVLKSSLSRIKSKKSNDQPLDHKIQPQPENRPNLLQSMVIKLDASPQLLQNNPSLKVQSKSNRPPSLKLTPRSSQYKQKIEQKDQVIEGSNQNKNKSEERKKLEDFEEFSTFKREVKNMLDNTSLSEFFKQINQSKFKQLPSSFHKQLTKKIQTKLKVQLLDSAIQQLARDCQSPISPNVGLTHSTFIQAASTHDNLLTLIFRTLFNQDSQIRESSKITEPEKSNSRVSPPKQPIKQPQKIIKNPPIQPIRQFDKPTPNQPKPYKSKSAPKNQHPISKPSSARQSLSTPKKYDYKIPNNQYIPYRLTSSRVGLELQNQLRLSYSQQRLRQELEKQLVLSHRLRLQIQHQPLLSYSHRNNSNGRRKFDYLNYI